MRFFRRSKMDSSERAWNLRSRGFEYYRRGKGDHEIWISESLNERLTVNAKKNKPKEVDWNSVRNLTGILKYSFYELLTDIQQNGS